MSDAAEARSDSLSALTVTDPSLADSANAEHSGEEVDDAHPGAGRLTGTGGLFVGLGLLMIGNGLNGAVIGVRSANEGFGVAVSGIIMAGYFAGFLLAPMVVVKMIPAVGHIRVFAGLASTASSAVLVHAIAVFPVSWALMRFVFGFCIAGLYIVIESWLAEMSDSTNRGKTMATYMIVSLGGLGAGQYLISLSDPNSFKLFVVSSVLVSMSLVPVTLAATSQAPVIDLPRRVSVRSIVSRVPTGALGSFLGGATVGIVLGLGAVYSAAIGLTLQRTAFFLVAPTIGAILFQWPIGRLSDKVSRRGVIFGVALAAATISVVLMLLPDQNVFVPVMMILLGGTMFPLYSLVVSYTIDWMPDDEATGATSTLIGINGAGALIGPLVAAPLMSFFGEVFFFWTITVAFSIIVVYVGWRIVFKDPLPRERQKQFVPFSARAASVAMQQAIKPVRKAAAKVSKVTPGKHVTSRRHPHGAPAPKVVDATEPVDRD